jgi:hypothetical protein
MLYPYQTMQESKLSPAFAANAMPNPVWSIAITDKL